MDMTLPQTVEDAVILGHVGLGHSPMIDRERAIIALRLTLLPLPGAPLPDAAQLVRLLSEAWPESGGRLSLAIANEELLLRVMEQDLPLHHMLEVPAFIACDPAHAERLKATHAAGRSLLMTGRPRMALERDVLSCFSYSIIDLSEERRDATPAPAGVPRHVPHVQSGVRTLGEMNDAFARGAVAVLGWPMDDLQVPPRAERGAPAKPELTAVMELIQRVDKGETLDRLEAVLKNDPTLAYKLLRYLNSPAFGLAVEVTSFRHAIMLLGLQRLKRWLALLLASGVRDSNLKPVIHAAVRRGLLMEAVGRETGADDERAGDLFICGVFSLLDRLLQQPFKDLLETIPTSEAVRAALEREEGPHADMLMLAKAVESASIWDIRDAAERLMLTLPVINRAVLKTLALARQLD